VLNHAVAYPIFVISKHLWEYLGRDRDAQHLELRPVVSEIVPGVRITRIRVQKGGAWVSVRLPLTLWRGRIQALNYQVEPIQCAIVAKDDANAPSLAACLKDMATHWVTLPLKT